MKFLHAEVEEGKEISYLRVGPERLGVASPALQYLLRRQSTSECIVGICPDYVFVSSVQKESSAIEGLCVFVEFVGKKFPYSHRRRGGGQSEGISSGRHSGGTGNLCWFPRG